MTMFGSSGFDVLRIRNRYEGDPSALSVVTDIVTEIESLVGDRPALFLHQGSPPAALKANADRYCVNTDPDCTLSRDDAGNFDYAGFAEYWRASLQAHEDADLHPDYVSIQNHPDWAPNNEDGVEACRFLPFEGTTYLTAEDGTSVAAELPGYRQALTFVQSAASSAGDFTFIAPEALNISNVDNYIEQLAEDSFQGIAFNFYTFDAGNPDVTTLLGIRALAEASEVPVLQTEIQAAGLESAIRVYYALNHAGAAAYLHLGFVGAPGEDPIGALISLDADTIVPNPNYYALSHYALHTDPGWVVVDSISDSTSILSTAFLSPDETALTVVLVNPSADAQQVQLTLPAEYQDLFSETSVSRTTFDGDERAANLGALTADSIVRIPGHGIVTVSGTQD